MWDKGLVSIYFGVVFGHHETNILAISKCVKKEMLFAFFFLFMFLNGLLYMNIFE